jgi:hypothetical protein
LGGIEKLSGVSWPDGINSVEDLRLIASDPMERLDNPTKAEAFDNLYNSVYNKMDTWIKETKSSASSNVDDLIERLYAAQKYDELYELATQGTYNNNQYTLEKD